MVLTSTPFFFFFIFRPPGRDPSLERAALRPFELPYEFVFQSQAKMKCSFNLFKLLHTEQNTMPIAHYTIERALIVYDYYGYTIYMLCDNVVDSIVFLHDRHKVM